jgi:hypothetical protein
LNDKNEDADDLFDLAAQLYAYDIALCAVNDVPQRSAQCEAMKIEYSALIGRIERVGGTFRQMPDKTQLASNIPVVFDADGKPFPYSIGKSRSVSLIG